MLACARDLVKVAVMLMNKGADKNIADIVSGLFVNMCACAYPKEYFRRMTNSAVVRAMC